MRSVTQVSSPVWKVSSPGNDPHPLGQGVKHSLCQQCWRFVPFASPCFPQKPFPGLWWALMVLNFLGSLLSVQNVEITWGLCHSLIFCGCDSVGKVLHLLGFGLGPAGAWGYMNCQRVQPGRCWDVDGKDLKSQGSENCWKLLLCL